VFADDRALSQEVIFGAPPGVGGSSGTPQGRFIFLDPRGDVDGDGETDVVSITLNNGAVNDGVRKPVYDPNHPGSADFHDFGTADRFNFRPFNYFLTPNRRINLFTKAEYDVSDSVVFKATAAFTNRKSANQAAPNPLFFGSDASAGFFLDNVFIPADQRFNPFGIDLDGRTNLITLGRRPLEAGPRTFEQNANTLMFSGAFEGNLKLGERTLFWDIGVSYGRNDATQRGRNIFNARKLALAVGPEDACLATPGCVPFNLFGGQGADGRGSITREMLAFTTFTQTDQSEQELNDVVANLSGDVVELPAGMLSYAVGLEYRKEQGSFTPDSTVQAGETADVPAQPTAGETRVTEGYLELRAPLLADLPAVQRLELSAAVRAFDYEGIGSDQIFKTGLYWRVFNDLSLRASYAQGFRAPNVGELFNSGSRFDAALNDPCSGFSAPGRSPQIAQNCTALGVPTSFSQINQQISVQTGGNRNLEPETSDSYTVGFGYRPAWAKVGWIDDATLDVNYYRIQVDDAIQALSAQVQLSNCAASLSPAFCGGIQRGPGGSITAFANQLTNIGRIETDGIDWTLSLASTPLRFGSLRLTWANTYLGGYKEFTLGATGLVATERAGTEVGSPTRGYVRYKSSLIGDWLLGNFVTSLTVRYLSELKESCPSALIDANLTNLCSDPAGAKNEIDARVFTDLQVAWAANVLGQDMQLALGVNNILDEDPPPCLSCDLNNYDGTLYPVPGRFLHARLAIKF
jgi:iron complex outermembrane receptor protein